MRGKAGGRGEGRGGMGNRLFQFSFISSRGRPLPPSRLPDQNQALGLVDCAAAGPGRPWGPREKAATMTVLACAKPGTCQEWLASPWSPNRTAKRRRPDLLKDVLAREAALLRQNLLR